MIKPLSITGTPDKMVTYQKQNSSAAVLTITNVYNYDRRDRLIKQTQQIGTGSVETIVANTYNELGVLINKKVGGTTANLQNIQYRYNIRGWLTHVNNPDPLLYDPSDNSIFKYHINYTTVYQGDTSKPQFNGNISSVSWRTSTDNIIRGYGYNYDYLNRLTYASHLKATIYNDMWFSFTSYNRDGQYAEDLTYDKNGNITTLKRFGEEELGQPIQTDELTYTYTSNQLQNVTDATNSPAGFNDGNIAGIDYTYDTFGNLKTDKNKSITSITYNHLNLPVEITFATGKITYMYDATGTKIKKVVQPNSGVAQTTDYLYGFQYLNGQLQFFPHAEGYVKPTATNSYLYVYQYKDHLGNVRLSYADCDGNGTINPATEILEENNYYPFGLQHQGYNDIANSCRNEEAEAYKFLNKEYEDSFALNVTETDYRHYDSALGRFNVMDALSELAYDFAPYRYGFNNPVFWSDASGLFETEAAARYYQLSHGLFGSSIEYDTDNGSWSINTGKSMITQIGDWILTTYELDGGGGGADWSKAGGSGSKDNSQSKKSDDGFWKFWERGGGFNVWGVMKDDPGFKPNSRKRGAVFASVNYDEAYERGKTSMMAGANWWKRYKDFLGGLDSRNSTLGERLNKTETKDV